MTKDLPSQIDPAEAFEAVRHELSLLHNAVLGLTAAREKIPDYSASLAELHTLVDDARRRAAAIQQSPSLQMTVATIAKDVQVAADAVRVEDRRMLEASRTAIDRSVGAIDAIVRRGQAVDQQQERLIWAACAGLVAGILLWSILPSAIARSLPSSWHVPEWMAARTLGHQLKVSEEQRLPPTSTNDGPNVSTEAGATAPLSEDNMAETPGCKKNCNAKIK